MTSLPISRLIDVQVTLTPQAAKAQSLSTLLILGTTDVIDVAERVRTYTSITDVADQFSSTDPEYLAALLWFEQAPQPATLQIGRWADADTHGLLVGGSLSAANSLVAAWSGISNGSFRVTIDGASAPIDVTGLDFSGVTTLNGVATVIDTALSGDGAGCSYDSNFSRFVISSDTTGPASTVSFLGVAATGTDVHLMLEGTAALGAYVADGIDAETALEAVELMDDRFGQLFYAVTVLGATDDENVDVAAFVEATTNKHLLGVTTQDAGTLVASNTSSIAYRLKQLGYDKTIVQYSSENAYAVCSLLGRILTVDYDGNSTVITLMYKQEPGIVAESLNATQIAALEGFNANVFVNYNNDTAIIEPGVMASGEFADTIIGADWLAVTIMTSVYNLLYTSPTKIPQTDAGVHQITTVIEQVCAQGVANGLLAPGTWNSAGVGTVSLGDFLPKGYYVYAQPVALQNASTRAARKAPPIQVLAKLAGAVQTVDVQVTVNS